MKKSKEYAYALSKIEIFKNSRNSSIEIRSLDYGIAFGTINTLKHSESIIDDEWQELISMLENVLQKQK